MTGPPRDRDPDGRPRNARPRDALGRPLPRSSAPGVDGAEETAPDEPALPPPLALRRAQELLDDGRPFTAHEVFEAVWKNASEAEQPLWRGLAQLAVGITHALRGNDNGSRALLSRCAETLEPFAGRTPHGVDVDVVRAWAEAASRNGVSDAGPIRLGGVGA